ncbi:B12-binding domain-containing radical SAM protein [Candidatus Latescibacterota bacterium]
MKIVLISTDESKVGMGVKTLSCCLLNNGFQTSIVLMATLEENYHDFAWNDLLGLCKDAGLIGISCMTHGVTKAIEIKSILTKHISTPIVIGGIHASLTPESLVEAFDFVCHGEGEDLIVELACRLEEKTFIENIPGLWLKKNGEIIRNPSVPLIKKLSEYPFPDYDISHLFILEANKLVQIRSISQHINIEDFVVLGSRGCPHHCTYCCNSKIKHEFPWRRKVLHYPIDYLIKHLKTVRKKFPEVKSFWIDDDTFLANRQEEINFFADRYEKEIALPFKINISPWTYQKEKLFPLIKAGMKKLIIGIQSGSERVNYDIYDRKISNKKLLEIAFSLHEYSNLQKYYDFIGMSPFESVNDLVSTIDFIKSLPYPYRIYNNNLAFYPGTELYEKAIMSGFDVKLRVKHSDPRIGFNIIINEKLKHKFFHLILLLMAGDVTRFRFGYVPKVFISNILIRAYAFIDNKYPRLIDTIATIIAFFLYHCQWRKFVKNTLSPKM